MRRLLIVALTIVLIVCCVFLINEYDKLWYDAPADTQSTTSPADSQKPEEIPESVSSEITLPDFSSLFCYSQLTDAQKVIYNRMVTEALAMTEGNFGIGECEVSDMVKAFSAVRSDLPELFWLSGEYSYSRSMFGVSVSFQSEGKTSYLCTKEERDEMQKALRFTCDNILKGIPKGASEYEKELYIYDYVCANTKYDTEGDYSLSSYGALVEKRAVCEGYSRAVQLLLRECGIDSTLVAGTALDTGHMWNLVKIENMWYHLDATWGDAQKDGTVAHGFFNINDEKISATHGFDPSFEVLTTEQLKNGEAFNFSLPKCDSLKEFYPQKEKCYLDDDIEASAETIKKVLREAADEHKSTAEFYIDSDEIDIVTKYGLNHCISEVNKKSTAKFRIPSVTYVGNSAVLSIKYEGE